MWIRQKQSCKHQVRESRPEPQNLQYFGILDLDTSQNLINCGAVMSISCDGHNVVNDSFYGVPDVAGVYKTNNIKWVVVGVQNYGEGSSRERVVNQISWLYNMKSKKMAT